MEGTFARVMNAFEQKWEQFIEEKGFHGFMDEYYGRWLHTYIRHTNLLYSRLTMGTETKKSRSPRPNLTPASESYPSHQTTVSSAAPHSPPQTARHPYTTKATTEMTTGYRLCGRRRRTRALSTFSRMGIVSI